MHVKRYILITGASDGIGKATALKLAKQKHSILILCRNEEKCKAMKDWIIAKTKNEEIDYVIADLSCLETVKEASKVIRQKFPKLNVLINNAGVFSKEYRTGCEGYELTFTVCHLGHFVLTLSLLDLLIKNAPSRIVVVSSMAHDFYLEDFEELIKPKVYNPHKAYAQAKLANLLFTVELARRLEGKGVTVNALHPGVVATKLLKEGWGLPIGLPPSWGAKTSIYLATSPEVEGITGKYFVNCKIAEPAPVVYNEELAKKFWEFSEKLTGLKFP